MAYKEGPEYVPLLRKSFEMYEALERETQQVRSFEVTAKHIVVRPSCSTLLLWEACGRGMSSSSRTASLQLLSCSIALPTLCTVLLSLLCLNVCSEVVLPVLQS
jgi:hypothetical protein